MPHTVKNDFATFTVNYNESAKNVQRKEKNIVDIF